VVRGKLDSSQAERHEKALSAGLRQLSLTSTRGALYILWQWRDFFISCLGWVHDNTQSADRLISGDQMYSTGH